MARPVGPVFAQLSCWCLESEAQARVCVGTSAGVGRLCVESYQTHTLEWQDSVPIAIHAMVRLFHYI